MCHTSTESLDGKRKINEMPLLHCVVTGCHGEDFDGPRKTSASILLVILNMF